MQKVAKTVLKQLQAAGGACDAEDLASLFDEKKTKKKKKRNKTKKADSEGVIPAQMPLGIAGSSPGLHRTLKTIEFFGYQIQF